MPNVDQDSIGLDNIRDAQRRLEGSIYVSPCVESISLSQITGSQVFCKLDSLQQTGNFKERGARHALECLDPQDRERGVITASAGNHGLALAYHGQQMGVPVTVVMSRFAPLIKVASCRRLGATVRLEGDGFDEAKTFADALADEQQLAYIHGFDAPDVIAGQDTVALEVLDQVRDLDAIVVPVGGAGLLAGVSVAVKALRPEVQIIGVEPEHAAGFAASKQAGLVVDITCRPTLADGLAVGRVGQLAFRLAASRVDRLVQVGEDALALAILRMVELEKAVVEGAGAAGLAALLAGVLPELRGKRVCLLICGGNIDPVTLGRVIEHGMVQDGRIFRFSTRLLDQPGGLEQFASVIARTQASIKDVVHDRVFVGPSPRSVRLHVTVETEDDAHIRCVRQALHDHGFIVDRVP